MLSDEQLRARCAAAGERLRLQPGTERAADLIEAL
jgi:UDP:flavonoid glycosyltransferase YjiC (YdhE family)